MGRRIKQVGLVPERRLGAVTMVDIEIDHRDSADAVDCSGMGRGHGNAVEQTESHGSAGFGMVSRGANRAERPPMGTRNHLVDGCNDGAGSPQGSLAGAWRKDRIGVDLGPTVAWHRSENVVNLGPRMDPLNLLDRRVRRRPALQPAEIGGFERSHDRPEAVGSLGMSGTGVVLRADRVIIE